MASPFGLLEGMISQQVTCGDSAQVLQGIDDASVHAVITDPPHGLFFMGSEWDRDLPEQVIWEQCYRVLKPGGHVWVMSSERWGCVANLYVSLRKAGFEVDETQIVNWLSLTGMPKRTDVGKVADKQAFREWLRYIGREFVACPNHKEPKDPETGERQRCVECERIFAEGALTHHDKRKAESAAVNGCHSSAMTRDTGTYYWEAQGQQRDWYSEQRSGKLSGEALLHRLLATHWPDSPSERREHWDAVVAEVPEDWDCSRPPGVRVKGAQKKFNPRDKTSYTRNGEKQWSGGWQEDDGGEQPYETAPSTPDAVRFDGWRGSVAPFKAFCYPVLHAQKPYSGTYLDVVLEHGVGPLAIDDCLIPFDTEEDKFYWRGEAEEIQKQPNSGGRHPANILSYGDLLGKLQKHADLSAWVEHLGLSPDATELLEYGLVYAPKPSQSEKNRGLPKDYSVKRNPCAKPVALCAYLISLSTRECQVVLDPFCGEAPVGVAATILNRAFVGVDLNPDFCQTARLRIKAAQTAANES